MANGNTITNVLTLPLTVKYGFTVTLMLLYLHNEQIKLPERNLLMNRMSKLATANGLINSNVSYLHPRVKTTNLCRLNASDINSISPRTVGAIQRQSYCVT